MITRDASSNAPPDVQLNTSGGWVFDGLGETLPSPVSSAMISALWCLRKASCFGVSVSPAACHFPGEGGIQPFGSVPGSSWCSYPSYLTDVAVITGGFVWIFFRPINSTGSASITGSIQHEYSCLRRYLHAFGNGSPASPNLTPNCPNPADYYSILLIYIRRAPGFCV